ncbi:type VI secretion system tube protein Hcp [Sutterella sp.]|uniref:Hcp family type VI secretion system effector n=1 Tax=Sutterella sp. TaxID=1981025 RepID=UPI0026E0CD29|nr:type VI secretion system tube protein Hcp [Sutterella sp.]MDO5532388.1 type VI secretion system tube protein Hcp [Sutterella sp.]
MATDFFIRIEGIEGESNDKSHGKWIEVVGFMHGSMQNVGAGRATDVAGRGQFVPFVFTHLLDKATPKLQQFCMSGQKIAKVEFQVCRAIGGAQVPVYEIKLENVKIARAEVRTVAVESTKTGSLLDTFSGVGNSYQPVEQVELIAGKMTWKVTPIKPDNTKDGAVEASFDQIANS